MKISSDHVAFITGGAQGIGLSIARALGKRGAKVMLADINAAKLAEAAETLSTENIHVDTVVCNVAKVEDLQAAAERTVDVFGKVHIVVNNAGVALGGLTGDINLEDWRWIVDINLMGVVYGAEVFTPIIRQQGEGGHIVNTASMAGHWASKGLGPYNATKFAVVGLSETMRQDLADAKIGVSVLCPGWVKTDIHNSHSQRPSGVESTAESDVVGQEIANTIGQLVENGVDPDVVGEWVAESIEAGRFYIFTHPGMALAIDGRAALLKADYDACIKDGRFGDAGGMI